MKNSGGKSNRLSAFFYKFLIGREVFWVIEIKNVSKTFSSASGSVEAVKNVSLSIKKGEIFGIIGFSGAGKSTLVRCINLLEVPTEGSIVVDGQLLFSVEPVKIYRENNFGKETAELSYKPFKLRERELRKARKKIGMIFQSFNLMPSRTVGQNVAFPLRGSGLSRQEIKQRVKELLELVDIPDKINAYPRQLSGGQKQRVAIARALANNPKVLLCDEATSALDPQTTQSILKLLKKLNKQLGLTIVIITHEMAVVKEICDRVAVMENGHVVEVNEVYNIFADPQMPITKDFIKTTSGIDRIKNLIIEGSDIVKTNPGDIVVKLTYYSKNVSAPLISDISRKYNVDVNIVFGNIEIIQDSPLGSLIAVISGELSNIRGAIEYLSLNNVIVEVIKR